MNIGDKVQATVIGEIVSMERSANGKIKYQLTNTLGCNCYVYEDNLINIHTESRREDELDAVTNTGK